MHTTLNELPRNVAFVGATNGLNNVLSPAGEVFAIDLTVYDSDNVKVGRDLPTLRNPIRHVTDSRIRQAESVIIAAMTFFDDMLVPLTQDMGIDDSRIHPLSPRD